MKTHLVKNEVRKSTRQSNRLDMYKSRRTRRRVGGGRRMKIDSAAMNATVSRQTYSS